MKWGLLKVFYKLYSKWHVSKRGICVSSVIISTFHSPDWNHIASMEHWVRWVEAFSHNKCCLLNCSPPSPPPHLSSKPSTCLEILEISGPDTAPASRNLCTFHRCACSDNHCTISSTEQAKGESKKVKKFEGRGGGRGEFGKHSKVWSWSSLWHQALSWEFCYFPAVMSWENLQSLVLNFGIIRKGSPQG